MHLGRRRTRWQREVQSVNEACFEQRLETRKDGFRLDAAGLGFKDGD